MVGGEAVSLKRTIGVDRRSLSCHLIYSPPFLGRKPSSLFDISPCQRSVKRLPPHQHLDFLYLGWCHGLYMACSSELRCIKCGGIVRAQHGDILRRLSAEKPSNTNPKWPCDPSDPIRDGLWQSSRLNCLMVLRGQHNTPWASNVIHIPAD